MEVQRRQVVCPGLGGGREPELKLKSLSLELFSSTFLICLLNAQRRLNSLESYVKYMSFSSFKNYLVLLFFPEVCGKTPEVGRLFQC